MLEQRLDGLDLELERLSEAFEELRCSGADVSAACSEAQQALLDAREREKVLVEAEDQLALRAQHLLELEKEVAFKESLLAQEESELIEERNRAEEELRCIQEEEDLIEQEALSLRSEFDDLGQEMDEDGLFEASSRVSSRWRGSSGPWNRIAACWRRSSRRPRSRLKEIMRTSFQIRFFDTHI